MAAGMKIAWWQYFTFWRWRVIGTAESADEIPNRLPRNAATLVADRGRVKWIVFDCPCRAGHRIMLNADPDRRPRWVLHHPGPLTISPSIDSRVDGRRCHYFIRNGRVEWAKDIDR